MVCACSVPSGLSLLSVRAGFFVARHRDRIVHAAGGDDDDRQILVDQGVRAVLHFAGGISLGVNLGNLIQLERVFERDGIVNTASQEERILRPLVFLGQFRNVFVASQTVSELCRNVGELLHAHRGDPRRSIVVITLCT
jgi:hypothetical protein